jgi:4-hydroxyphenylpyruvate dioxygenase
MGPFPHDAPKAVIDASNVAGTDGLELVEFAHPNPIELEALFQSMGYIEVARHKARDISLYRQGDINYILNREPNTHASRFVEAHGPCAPAMAWRCVNAAHALKCAVDYGAEEYTGTDKTLDVPAVVGIG